MQRSAWSLALTCVLTLGLGATGPGCIGKRRPPSERTAETASDGRIVQPKDVDGSLDALVEGDRALALYDAQDPYRGAAVPLVTIIEYSDFQCPYCSTLADSLDDLMVEYGSEVKLVFKQLPLQIHPQAEPAARAALAAHAQGKFWEMHDRLFANRRALSDSQLERHARELGLDVERWRKDFSGADLSKHVKDEMSQGSKLGVSGTPTFFINGKRYSGAMSVDQLRGLVAGEILAAQQLLKAGAKREELYARFLHPALQTETGIGTGADATPTAAAKPTEPSPTPKAAEGEEPPPADPSAQERFAIPVGKDRPQRGPADALVTIVEFATFGCDDCAEVQGTVASLLERHPEDVRHVFRTSARSASDRRAAHIALAAHKQGLFWKAHDALLEHEGDFTAEQAAEFARTLGLDVEQFNGDLRGREDGAVNLMVRDDVAVLDALGRREPSPILFVNGRRVDGKPTLAALEAMVRQERAKAEAFLAANPGTDRAGLYEAMRRTWTDLAKLDAVAKPPKAPTAP